MACMLSIGALLTLAPLAYWTSLFAPSATPRWALIDCVCPVLLAALLIGRVISGRPLVFGHPLTLTAVVTLLGIHVLSVAWTPDRLGAILWNSRLFSLACWFGIVAICVHRRWQADMTVIAAVCGAVPAALIGILHHFQIEPPPYAQTLPPGSTFVYANVGAQFIAPFVPLVLLMTLRAMRLWTILAWALAFLATAGYVALTRCRGAWLAVVVSMFLTMCLVLSHTQLRRDLWQRFSRAKIAVVLLGIIAAIAAAALVPLGTSAERRATWSEMLRSFTEPLQALAANPEEVMSSSSSMRVQMLRCTLRALQDHWMAGLGSDGFRAGIVPYLDQPTATICYTPVTQMLTLHCDPLQVVLETGAVGGVALLVAVLGVLAAGWRAATRHGDADARWLALGCLAGLVAIGTHSLVSFPFHMPTSALLAVTLAGIVVGLDRTESVDQKALVIHGRPLNMVLAALLATAAITNVKLNLDYLTSMRHLSTAWIAKRAAAGQLALREIDAAVAACNLPYVVRREYGVIHARFNPDREAALRSCRRALAHDPHYINNLVNVAGIEMELGRHRDAKRHLQQALTINDELHLAHHALGLIAVAEEHPDAARTFFERCLELQPGFKPARRQLDQLLGQR